MLFSIGVMFVLPAQEIAQANVFDRVMNHSKGKKLSIGGYGEVAYSRNFYSDNQYRYRDPAKYKNDPSSGRFDIPHAVIYLGYDFGKGWTMGTEIEFEHTGTGSAVEIETDEGGEYETEIEKGGEVELEQFWIQKSFARWANLKIGHFVVPVGLNNAHHEPLNFFNVYRHEGENTILPSTWHGTGVSFWGRHGDFRYEVQVVAGLDAFMFSRDNWAKNAADSAFEFKPANKYGFAARIDNYTISGLRLAVSGYYGRTMHNTYPNEREGKGKLYDKTKGNVLIGSFDFTFKRFNWIVRGNFDYGTISDASVISNLKMNTTKSSPYNKTHVGKAAIATAVEAGYDILSQIASQRAKERKLYLFGRYDYYNSFIKEDTQPTYDFTKRSCLTFGINYYPVPQIAIKADYSNRMFKSEYNNDALHKAAADVNDRLELVMQIKQGLPFGTRSECHTLAGQRMHKL